MGNHTALTRKSRHSRFLDPFWTLISAFLGAAGKIVRTGQHHRPETLLASALAFPAKVVVRYPPPFIEEEGQFQFPLFRHSRHSASLNKNPPISAVTAAIDG